MSIEPSKADVPGGAAPRVSVVIANFNGARFLDAALNSARKQTLRDIEIIFVDDASTDDSVAIAQAHAAADRRLRVLARGTNQGPAVCRNHALAHAMGDWISVLDSDDLMHASRLERLVGVAEADGAEIVADEMLVFDDAGVVAPHVLRPTGVGTWIDLPTYIRSNALFGRAPSLGYLKPLIRRNFLRRHGIRYNETMRVAEDYDLVARILARGGRFRVVDQATYFYRKHNTSISHRLTRGAIVAMVEADAAFRADHPPFEPAAVAALDLRCRSLRRALAFEDLVAAVKERRWVDAIAAVRMAPGAATLLRMPLAARLRRLVPRASPPVKRRPGAVVLSRQRIVGATNGSSAYLLSLCESLVAAGMDVHFVGPSPAAFGRWPVLALRPEMRCFTSIRIRGGLRIGPFVVARDPRVMTRAALTVLDRVAGRLGLGSGPRIAPAPYSVAVPWTTEDFVFVARHARANGDVVIADYAFLTEGIAYALRPGSRCCVIMHDLFSCRAIQFSSSGEKDSVASITLPDEMALLARADAVVAIQEGEADVVRQHLPRHSVIVAPMGIRPATTAHPGQDDALLFVASNTMPNIVGLRWFIDAVWPTIRREARGAKLRVAGGIKSAFDAAPDGVEFLGRVDDLTALYRDAGVVISPLLQGSGLKIKLVEAMGHGKAIVATPATVQGVEALVADVLPVTDDADRFAHETLQLMGDRALRLARGNASLAIARGAFSSAACHRDFVDFIVGAGAAGQPTSAGAARGSEMAPFIRASAHPA